MPVGQAYLEMVREMLAPLATVSVRRMFGGAGIYCEGVMFALIEDDVLYFKADAETAKRYQAEGMTPFTFEGQTRMVETSYWRAPDRLFDDADDMLGFAREALTVAAKLQAAKRPRRTATAVKPAASAPSKSKYKAKLRRT